LRRPAAKLADERWTRGDVALVDEAQWRIAGVPRTYSHVIVDEVQDLSPMELRMVGRRASTGAMTFLGDLAQSIGEWSYDDWSELVAHLPKAVEPRFMELTIGYRVPRQMIDMASRLLPSIAPTLAPPVAIREGEPPTMVRAPAGRLVHQVIREMRDAFALEGSVGILVPDGRRHEVEAAARAAHIEFDGPDWGRGRKLTVMSSREAKGMEFDHVLLVEPAELLTGDVSGRRELYVALTRATQTLRIVHTLDLPAGLGALPLAG
jgi:DNA helicase IV